MFGTITDVHFANVMMYTLVSRRLNCIVILATKKLGILAYLELIAL